MPKISRIRIVNFSYNNNKRHIQDETFDFYQGENVLFSLANGGGKSVLVQAMLQPILPKASLLGRKIGDFFVSRNTPSYIMIEWKLDDDAGYLLSGISIMPSVTHSTIEEEQTTNIRYYTFIHEYGAGNTLDIKNIPVTEPLGNHLKISSYNDFRKFIKKEEEKAPYKIGVFSSEREEQRKYERKLASYGIYIDEWKDLVVKINEAEHGVSEVFTRCKTSKMVMEQWIIKYIEDVLNKSSTEHSDHEKLQTMMSKVAESMVENEHHVKEYERISDFIADSEKLYNETKAILSSLDEEMKRKKDLRASLNVLTTEEGKLDDELQNLETENNRLNNEIRHIDLEKKSLEIYRYIEELERIEEALASLKDRQVHKEATLQETRHNLAIQKAAEKFHGIREKEQRLANLNERLANAMKDEAKLARDLNQVKYSLKLAYGKVLDVCSEKIKRYEEAQSLHSSNIDDLNEEIDKCQFKLRGLERELGGLNIEIGNFEEQEATVFEQLGLALYRNPLIRELDPRDIEDASNKLNSGLSNIQEQIESTKQEIKNTENEIIRAEEEREELADRQLDARDKLQGIIQEIKRYEEERGDILSILNTYNISESELFDRETILGFIKEKINSWDSKSLSLRMSINDADKLLNGIEEGISYMPPRLVAMLKEHNLHCYTGEQYLKGLDDAKRKALLEQNPLLPYALILTEKEYSQIAELLDGEELSQIVPILRYQDRDTMTLEAGSIETDTSEIRFFASARMMDMNADDRNAYIEKLAENKEFLLAELEGAKRVLEESNREYQIVYQFAWSKEKVDSLYQSKAELEGLLIQYEGEANQLKHLVEESRNNLKGLTATVDRLEHDRMKTLQSIELFKRYLNDNNRYMENLAKASNINGELSRTQTRVSEIKEEITNEEKQLRTIADSLSMEKRNRLDLEAKYDGVKDANEDALLHESLSELEGKLEAYKGKQTSEVSDIRDQKDIINRELRSENRQLQKLGLALEEYEGVVYNEKIEMQLESDIKALDKEINSLISQFIEEDKHKTRVETKKGRATEDLRGEPLVPASEIRGEFESRIQKLRNQINVNKAREVEIQRLFIRIKELITLINAWIPGIMSIEVDSAITRSFAEVEAEVEGLIEQYKETENSTNRNVNHFNRTYTDLQTKYQLEQAGVVIEAFKSIQAQVDGLSRSYDKYYYLSERLDSCIVKLGEVLKIMEGKVLQLEHDQKNLVEHAFMEAMRIYREIPKISENSSVMIDGVRKKVLEIQFDKVEDELAAKEKMSVYIKESLDTLTKLIKDKEDSNRIRRELEKFISTKELLNVISSLESYVIKAYKVDLNEKNRRMMPWEDIIVRNSGGEKFVAYFSLLVALISYSRGRSRDTLLKKEDSKVLIMDNPFGPITSGHLLKPMFDIAEKYNTQLICLSDIKQGSVLDRFKLIYMVKIRQNMMQDEYLEFEPHAFADLTADEKLENAHIYSSTQLGLF
jgi:DNA repair exonuclease SbcCD ATPase subunit